MFYERFIELCEARGVTPSVVAKEIGLSNSAVTYWKRGSIPNAKTVQKVSDYFCVPVSYFYNEKPIPGDNVDEMRRFITESVLKMSDDPEIKKKRPRTKIRRLDKYNLCGYT